MIFTIGNLTRRPLTIAMCVSIVLTLVSIGLSLYTYDYAQKTHAWALATRFIRDKELYLFPFPFVQVLISAVLVYLFFDWDSFIEKSKSKEFAYKSSFDSMRDLDLAFTMKLVLVGFCFFSFCALVANFNRCKELIGPLG